MILSKKIMKSNCVICFEKVETTTLIKKWECSHLFHESCIEHWDHNCPLCRNPNIILPEITWSISRNPQCPLWMNQIQDLVPTIEDTQKYQPLWKDHDCITNQHNMFYYQMNPIDKTDIICICENCNTYQKFNKII